MRRYQFNDPLLAQLDGKPFEALQEKVRRIGRPFGYTESRLDAWMANFRGEEEKSLALKLFMRINYYDEVRIEEMLLQYRKTVEQYLTEIRAKISDLILVVPEGAADSAGFHAYKLVKQWGIRTDAVATVNQLSKHNASGKFYLFFNDTHGSGDQFVREFSAFINRVGSSSCIIASIAIAKPAYQRFKEAFPDTLIIPDIPTQSITDMNDFTGKELQRLSEINKKVYKKHPNGYGGCGILVAYHFQCPNNTLPVFWADGTNNQCADNAGGLTGFPWTPLFPYRAKTNSGKKNILPVLPHEPFVGLRPLRDTDRSIFFGRDTQKKKISERIEKGSVIVVGASGTGKSSLVWAGVIPALIGGSIDDAQETCPVVRLTPGEAGGDPIRALADALTRYPPAAVRNIGSKAVELLLRHGVSNIDQILSMIFECRGRDAKLIIFVDQLEELFTSTVATADEDIDIFFNWFGAFASEERVRIIATLRSDFVGKMMAHPATSRIFGDSFADVLFPLLPPSERNLYEMIEMPARIAGIEFEQGLVDKIVEDTGMGDSKLPLMAYALEQLAMRDSKFTIANYLDSGGIDGAIERKVAEALQNIHSEYSTVSEVDISKAVISVFAKLLDVDEDTGAATRRRCLMSEFSGSAINRSIVNEFINSRLLSADNRSLIECDGSKLEPTVEVAHEAIFRRWGMLREWIDFQKDAFVAKKSLLRDAREWAAHGRRDYMRWSDERCLEIAAKICQIGYVPTSHEVEFLGATDKEVMLSLIRAPDTLHETRQSIGVRLALMGDPRRGTGTIAGVPDFTWCSVDKGVVQLTGIDRVFVVEAFLIAKYPITQAQFRLFVDAEDGYRNEEWWEGLAEREHQTPGRQYPAYDNYPAVNVDWMEAIAYCRWVSKKMGYEVRLPTEAEWQLAASYGRQGVMYPWGDQFDSTRANTYESDLNRTIAVGLYAQGFPNDAPLDLCGNVWEWCLDEFEAPTDVGSVRYSDIQPRVRRGGSWDDGARLAASTSRFYRHPHQRYSDIGFRVLQPIN